MAQKMSKDALSILDFSIDLTNLLQTSEIVQTSTWTVPTGITKVTDTHNDDMTTVWLSGGTLNTIYELVNTVVTNSVPTRTFINRIYISIVKK